MGLKCLHASIFIKTPSLEGWKEDPSSRGTRQTSAGHQPIIIIQYLLLLLLSLLLLLLLVLLLLIQELLHALIVL